MFRCRLLTVFKINFFQKILLGTRSECQTVWIQIRTDILSVLIWILTICKGHQQTTSQLMGVGTKTAKVISRRPVNAKENVNGSGDQNNIIRSYYLMP